MNSTNDSNPSQKIMQTPLESSPPQISEFVTSAQAAKRLGLSMATIQKLVDKNILQAWKTFGGHRRISLESVLNFHNSNNIGKYGRRPAGQEVKMMIIIESPGDLADLKLNDGHWHLPMGTPIFESLSEAMLELVNQPYDLLVFQMDSPRQKQEKTLEILKKFMASRHTLAHTLVLTPELDLLPSAENEDTKLSIQVLNQHLSPDWLSAYLLGFQGQRQN